MTKIQSIIFFTFSLAFQVIAQPYLGETVTIDSKILGESREVVISLPERYKTELFYQYPVIYLTDADTQFNHIASTVHLLNGTISPMIVVGIKQKKRMSELSPFSFDKTANGNSEKFRQFLTKEVKAFVESSFRTTDFSILSGHSVGGAFVLNAYFQNKDSFDFFLALSPTLAWGNEQLLSLLPNVYKSGEQPKLATFFEGNSIFPTPNLSYQALNQLKQTNKHLSATHSNMILENEDHVSVSHLGSYLALTELYRGWFLSAKEVMKNPSSFDTHYQRLTDKLGYEIRPTENELWQLTQALISAKEIEHADAISKKALAYYPNSKFSFVLLADIAKTKSDISIEKGYLIKAIELSNHDVIRKTRYQKRLSEL